MSNASLISNGSLLLDPFVDPNNVLRNGSYPFNASLFYRFASGNLNWTTPQADLGILTYDPSKTNMWAIGKTVDQLFRPSVFSYEQECVYAISGQYGFLPRLLYYVLLIFCLFLRRHLWLSTAALGAAMTYAATASVHAFALLLRFKYELPSFTNLDWISLPPDKLGDLDLQAIFPILVAGSIMLTPILSFSTTVRKHQAHYVVIFWGILIFCAMVPTFVIVIKTVTPSIALSQVSTCTLDPALGCTYDNLMNNYGGQSLNLYKECNCNDTCGALNLPDTPMRHNQGVSALLISNTVGELIYSPLVFKLYKANSLFLIWIIAQGILAIIENQATQPEVRNWTFRTFAGDTPLWKRATFGSKLRYYLVKSIAGYYFVAAIACAFVCPFIFVSSVIVNEFNTWSYPISESEDAVGQWGTWVSAAFVIIAAIIQEISTRSKVVRKDKLIWWKEIAGKQPKGSRVKKDSKVEDMKNYFNVKVKDTKDSYKDFKSWYDDPVGKSKKPPPSGNPSEDESQLEYHYEHPKVPLVRVRHSPRSQTTPSPRSRSQSPMLQSSPYTPPWSPEIPTRPYGRPRSNSRNASMGSLRPSLASAYSSTELFSRQGSSDRLVVPEHHTESELPPQAAWAATVVRPC